MLYEAASASPCGQADLFTSLFVQSTPPPSHDTFAGLFDLSSSDDTLLRDFDWPTPNSLWDTIAMTFKNAAPPLMVKTESPEPYCRGQFTPQQEDIFVSNVQEMARPPRRCDNIPNSSNTPFDPSQYDIDIKLGVPGKPYSYARLITYAIAHSDTGKMSLSDIYDFCVKHFPYFSEVSADDQ